MSEVLKFEYDAARAIYVGTVDAVREVTDEKGVKRTVTIVGGKVANPSTVITRDELRELDPGLSVDLERCLALLEPIIRAKAARDVADPKEVMRISLENQRVREEMAKLQENAERIKAEATRAELELIAKRAEHDELDAALVAKRLSLVPTEPEVSQSKKSG